MEFHSDAGAAVTPGKELPAYRMACTLPEQEPLLPHTCTPTRSETEKLKSMSIEVTNVGYAIAGSSYLQLAQFNESSY